MSATKDPGVVNVTFRDPASGEITELTYRMAKTQTGWRVHAVSAVAAQLRTPVGYDVVRGFVS